MKFILASAAAAALMLASPAAFAQNQDHHGHGGHGGNHQGSHGGGDHKAPSAPAAKPAPAPAAAAKPAARAPSRSVVTPTNVPKTPDNPNQSWARAHGYGSKGVKVQTTASPGAVYNNAVKNNDRNDRRDNDRHDNNRRDNDRNNNWNSNDRHGNDRHDNNNWRGDNNRHGNHGSWSGRFDRRNVTAQHHYRYRGDRWRWPRGYSYQRWAFGMTLPSIFWASNYWINDYYYYGLGAPPPGTVWVRYGDDAVLIDRYSGEILEVVYDQFY
jgi:Ni/Co efflux regulator RcnB